MINTTNVSAGPGEAHTAFALSGVLVIVGASSALADQPTGLEPNPNHNSFTSDNCIAYFSAQWQHNGLIVRGQDRQSEINALQVACNNASDKT
jgi:hypothetical protein